MLTKFAEKGLLVESGVDVLIKENSIDADDLIDYAIGRNEFIISKSLLAEYISKEAGKDHEQRIERESHEKAVDDNPVKVSIQKPVFRALASEVDANIQPVADHDVSGKSTCNGTVQDFVSLFRSRYSKISSILRIQPSQHPTVNYRGSKSGDKCRFIGMVRSKSTTKNGHVIIEAEDEDGVLKIFISKNNLELQKICADIVLDEVLAFDGSYKDPFFYVDSISWPDVPLNKEKKLIKEDLSIAFLSDLHVGSNLFLEKQFGDFLSWLKGNTRTEREKGIVSTIKYLLVSGDMVDGIGIYPNQEKELSILDIYEQYNKLFELMSEVPEHIHIVFIPGNHDAVRRGDPQPHLPEHLVKDAHSNFHFGSSPSWYKIEGLNVLMYHVNSLDSMIASISGMSYNSPEKVMEELLKRRHLGPLYGSHHMIPEDNDYLVIDDVPDIVHMGHVHKNGYAEYRNVCIVNSGTWQDITNYQKMQGHVPSPGLLPVYNMKRGSLSVIDFNNNKGGAMQ